MFLSKLRMRVRSKPALSFLSVVMLVAGFSQSASASCERTVYNKSDSTWVIRVGGKTTSNLFDKSHQLSEFAAKGKKVIESSKAGWTIIIYPNETRRIHYDDTYYDDGLTIDMTFKTISDPWGVQFYMEKTFSLQAFDNGILGAHAEFASFIKTPSTCGYISHSGNTGPRLTVNQPADGDIIFEPTKLGTNCVNLFTEVNGGGKKLNLCERDHNWKDYTNLGSVGNRIHSHHYAVKSFQCGSGIDHLKFVDGNRDSVAPILQNCHGGIMSNVDATVTKHGTGAGVYK